MLSQSSPHLPVSETKSTSNRLCGSVAETEKYPHVTYFFNGGDEHAAGR